MCFHRHAMLQETIFSYLLVRNLMMHRLETGMQLFCISIDTFLLGICKESGQEKKTPFSSRNLESFFPLKKGIMST